MSIQTSFNFRTFMRHKSDNSYIFGQYSELCVLILWGMSKGNMEQPINTKFCMKIGKSTNISLIELILVLVSSQHVMRNANFFSGTAVSRKHANIHKEMYVMIIVILAVYHKDKYGIQLPGRQWHLCLEFILYFCWNHYSEKYVNTRYPKKQIFVSI